MQLQSAIEILRTGVSDIPTGGQIAVDLNDGADKSDKGISFGLVCTVND